MKFLEKAKLYSHETDQWLPRFQEKVENEHKQAQGEEGRWRDESILNLNCGDDCTIVKLYYVSSVTSPMSN